MATEEHQATAVGEVLVKLSSNGPKELPWPERRIRLTRENNSVPIGRASKVRSKGFVAAKTNGWFDSPVMSRDHAELVADFDSKTVTIRDIGSLHGTFLNKEKERIVDHVEQPLADGDTITFGVAIWRGKDTYAPTTVEVGLEFTDTGEITRNTFKVPDYTSDVEDSDSMSDAENEPDTTIHTGLFLHLQSSDHIDLTGEDENRGEGLKSIAQFDGPAGHRIIDLTSPLRAESPDISPPVEEDAMSAVDPEDGDHIDSDVEFDAESSIRLTDEEGSAVSDDDAESDESDSSSEDEEHEEQEEEYSSDDEIISDEVHGLFNWQETDEEVEVAVKDIPIQDTAGLPPITYQAVYEAPFPPLGAPIPPNQVLPSIADTQVPSTLALPSIISTSAREPSPSDAAMMKSSIQPQMTAKPSMAALKEKTGKHAFFEAREENKATMARQGNTYPSPPSAPLPAQTLAVTTQKNPLWSAPQMPDASESNDKVQPGHSSQPATKSPWHATGDTFLNTPQEDRILAQDHDQPDDAEEAAMISAYEYNKWKHRRIGINDIVMGQEECDLPQRDSNSEETPKKRKSTAISTTTPEEEIWQDEQRKEDANTTPVVQPISPPASPPELASRLTSEPVSRPSKRMRRIAERVGYAALGGATVGAMIVTSLIYTAPSFA